MKIFELKSKATNTNLAVIEYSAIDINDIERAEKAEDDFCKKGYSYYNTECGFLTTRIIFDTNTPII